MGKTCPTYRMLLEEEISSWSGFRRALRKEDQIVFDRVMDCARKHASAAQLASRMNPFEALIMSAIIEMMKDGSWRSDHS
jgi:hypothetical protein